MNRQLFHNMVAQYESKTVMDLNQVITWSGGAHCNLPSLKFYGESKNGATPTQTTPTPDNPLGVYGFSGPFDVENVLYTGTPTLHGIGEYKDEWDYVTGKGVRRVASVTLDGVTSGKKLIAVYNNKATGLYFGLLYTEYKSIPSRVTQAISTHYRYGQGMAVGNVYIAGSGDTELKMLYLVHTDQTLDTVDKYNAWLKAQYDAGTPVTVYYALAEPIPFEERVEPYQPIPNDRGRVNIIDSGMNTPFEVTYITHS